MSGTSPTPAEQHLGDRLAALIDGELKHDARDRVLAHLATCPKCKAEADAQRSVKSVFASTAPPPPSEGLLARLQGLPAGPPGGDDTGAGGPFDGGRIADGVFGALNPSAGRGRGSRGAEGATFGYVPGGAHATVLPEGSGGGFRIHDVGRPEADRSPWRGRRFAFAAASAVSFAAIALGAALPLDGSAPTTARGDGSGNKVTPLRSATPPAGNVGSNGPTGSTSVRGTEAERRRSGGNGLARSETRPVIAGAPSLLPPAQPPGHPFPAAFLSGSSSSVSAVSPLIRPTGSAFQLATAPAATPSVTPGPTHLSAPTESGLPLSSRR
ncbi:zf-HC2 domain-containing protein [Streptomyces sp. NPDC051907]|uniref:anti-sigma factor family protein n=1 Tax=Streptomyces sp. NPDC051907 TaxID=3155284 RepID=UPI003418CA0B